MVKCDVDRNDMGKGLSQISSIQEQMGLDRQNPSQVLVVHYYITPFKYWCLLLCQLLEHVGLRLMEPGIHGEHLQKKFRTEKIKKQFCSQYFIRRYIQFLILYIILFFFVICFSRIACVTFIHNQRNQTLALIILGHNKITTCNIDPYTK